jgi:microcystin-dependent protein
MALESGTYIDDLVSSNPPQSDSLSQSAGHLRLLKSVILATFPNITGAVTGTHTELNAVVAAVAAAQYVPAGTIHAFAGATLPTGYLWCDGTSYLRATYAGLFTAIGTTWGAADGTHFNVPNFKDRFLIGRATMGATTDAAIIDSLLDTTTLGSTYDGEGAIDTITLTTTELPAHTHGAGSYTASGTTGADASHTHSFSGTSSSDGAHTHTVAQGAGSKSVSTGSGDAADRNQQTSSSNGAHTHTFSGTTGAGSSHTHSVSVSLSGTSASSGTGSAFTVAILPPSAVVNYIIKT